MEEKHVQVRKAKINIQNAGGSAGKTSKKYFMVVPTAWARSMGISPDERDVVLTFDGTNITIKKGAPEELENISSK